MSMQWAHSVLLGHSVIKYNHRWETCPEKSSNYITQCKIKLKKGHRVLENMITITQKEANPVNLFWCVPHWYQWRLNKHASCQPISWMSIVSWLRYGSMGKHLWMHGSRSLGKNAFMESTPIIGHMCLLMGCEVTRKMKVQWCCSFNAFFQAIFSPSWFYYHNIFWGTLNGPLHYILHFW